MAGVIVDEAVTVSPSTVTLTRETRDEVLDASRGAFLSQAFQYSPRWLGSDQPYIKYLGQYFHYFPLHAPRRKPFTNEILRPRLVYATGVRIGLAMGHRRGARAEERAILRRRQRQHARFRAEHRRPNRSRIAIPLGGEALLVINNELRVPLVSIVDGVLFARHRQRLPHRAQLFLY